MEKETVTTSTEVIKAKVALRSTITDALIEFHKTNPSCKVAINPNYAIANNKSSSYSDPFLMDVDIEITF